MHSTLLLLLALATVQLAGCSAPQRATVESRETSQSKLKRRPAYHQVRKGDTLYSIAWRYGLDSHSLASWNAVRSPYTIFPGQRLRLSKPPVTAPRKATSTGKPAPTNPKASHPPAKSTSKPRAKATPSSRPQSKPKPKSSPTSRERLKLSWGWPTTGEVIQRFKRGDPARKGIKIRGRNGQLVKAAEGGKVVYAGSGLIGYGRLVIIKHNKNYLSAYGHNRRLLVKEGTNVRRGQVLAEMGRGSGGGTMLHFEIRRNGAPVDPTRLLPKSR